MCAVARFLTVRGAVQIPQPAVLRPLRDCNDTAPTNSRASVQACMLGAMPKKSVPANSKAAPSEAWGRHPARGSSRRAHTTKPPKGLRLR